MRNRFFKWEKIVAINWNTFGNNLQMYFDNFVAQKEDDAADFLATQYEIAVLMGVDMMYGNMVTSYNSPGLKSALKTLFKQLKNLTMGEMVPTLMGTGISNGLIQFWSGASLALLVPPPGTVGVVSNMVTSPGTPIPILSMRKGGTQNKSEFINNLIKFFRQHLSTLSGITTALVPTPSGAPIPTPFLWGGYG